MAIDEKQPLELMISSRCQTEIRKDDAGATETLSALRTRAKAHLESSFSEGTERLFDVWINEDERDQTLDESWYSASEERARRAELVIVLFTGDSGSRRTGTMGVCHAELVAALADTRTKVRLVDLRPAISHIVDDAADHAFVKDVTGRGWVFQEASTGDAAVACIAGEALAAVRTLAHHGSLDLRRSSKSGSEIEWGRKPFDERKNLMETTLVNALGEVMGPDDAAVGPTPPRGRAAIGVIRGRRVLFVCHGAPQGLALAASREMVGQPFLQDHLLASGLKASGKDAVLGPVHVIASMTAPTEAQARRLLGFPDATVVKDAWGVWVSDPLQRIQMVLLDRCTSESAVRARVQQAIDWLGSTGEDATLLERAERRARIVLAMA